MWGEYKKKVQGNFETYTVSKQVPEEQFYVNPEPGTEIPGDFSHAVWAYNLPEELNDVINENSCEAQITDETLIDTDLLNEEEFAEKGIDSNIEITEIRFYIEVPCICQNPELLTGCEATAAVAALNYMGIDINKTDFVSNYLECGTPGEDSPFDKFLGNSFKSRNSYGCYAPVIIKAIKKLLEEKQIDDLYTISDLSGNSVDYITENYVKNGIPVIIWATMYMIESTPGTKWKTEKYGTIIWRRNEHCVVLVGRDTSADTVIVMDPLTGKYEDYDYDTFCLRYEEQYSQAVAVGRK